ncbi:hypothetical protein BKA64DRAFT_665211, partial [Cadophora sp. MPI-SDFR-AT-0126]
MSPSMPPEIISCIISYLLVPEVPDPMIYIQEPARIARYATVSKEWQKSVERQTYSTLHLTPTRIEEFGRIVHENRRQYVHHINLDIVLNAYDEVACGRYESDEDQERNNQVFTETFQELFKIIGSWEDSHIADVGVSLSVKVYSPSDISALGQMEARARRRKIGGPKDILDRRFHKSYLKFIFDEAGETHLLDVVPAFKEIAIEGGISRHIWPASCSFIASKTPRLRSLRLGLWDNEKKDIELRKRARDEFANSLDIWSPSIQKLYLSYYNQPPQDESFMPPILLTDPNGEDLLSISLGIMSQQLTKLTLEDITIGPELFFNSKSSTKTPEWPHLTSLTINYNPITPSGHWLFERDPSEDVEEYEEGEDPSLYMEADALPAAEDLRSNFFRHKASPEQMNRFYNAIGKAALSMPVLRDISMRALTTYWEHWFMYKATSTSACAAWGSTPEFKPDESVLDVWREVSRKNLEVELEVKYEDPSGGVRRSPVM